MSWICINTYLFLLVIQLILSSCKSYLLKNNSRLVFIGGSHLFHGSIHHYGFYNLMSEELSKASLNVELKSFSPDSSRSMLDLRADLRHHMLENDLLQSGDIVVLMVGSDDIKDIGNYVEERNSLSQASASEDGSNANSADMPFEVHHIDELIRQRQYELTAHWHSIVSLLMEFEGLDILVATSFIQGEKTDGSNKLDEIVDEFCGAIKRFATDHSIEVIDIRHYLVSVLENLNFENLETTILTWDEFNLNELGHKHVAYFLLESLKVSHTLTFGEDLSLSRRKELRKKDLGIHAEVSFGELNFEELLSQTREDEGGSLESDRAHDSFRGDML